MMLDFPSGQRKIVLTVGVMISVIGLLFYLGVYPLLTKVQNTQSQILHDNEQLVKLLNDIDQYKSVGLKFAKIEESVDEVSGIFSLREDAVTVVEAIENAIDQSGVAADLSIVDQKEDTTSQGTQTPTVLIKNLVGIDEVPYALHFTGSYKQIANLFLYLENMPFFTQISRLGASAQSVTAQNGKSVVRTGTADGEIQGVLFLRQP